MNIHFACPSHINIGWCMRLTSCALATFISCSRATHLSLVAQPMTTKMTVEAQQPFQAEVMEPTMVTTLEPTKVMEPAQVTTLARTAEVMEPSQATTLKKGEPSESLPEEPSKQPTSPVDSRLVPLS